MVKNFILVISTLVLFSGAYSMEQDISEELEAEQEVEQAMANAFIETCNKLGTVYLPPERDPDKALASILQLLSLNDTNNDTNDFYKAYRLGLIHQQEGHIEQALCLFKQASDHDVGEASLALGRLLKKQSRESAKPDQKKPLLEKAQSYLLRAVEKKIPSAVFSCADSYRMQNNIPEARRYYLQTVKQNPSNRIAWYNLGVLAERDAQNKLAKEYYKKADQLGSKLASDRLKRLHELEKFE